MNYASLKSVMRQKKKIAHLKYNKNHKFKDTKLGRYDARISRY